MSEPLRTPALSSSLPIAPLTSVVNAPSGPPRVWTLAVAFVLLVVGMLLTSGLAGLVVAIREAARGSAPSSPEALARTMGELLTNAFFFSAVSAGNNVLELLLALVPAALSAVAWRERLRLSPAERLAPGGWALGAVGAVAVGTSLGLLAELSGFETAGPMRLLGVMAERATPGGFALLLLVGSVGAGVGEELFFRGYLQTRLVERWGRWPGITVAALAFALVHFDPLHSTFAFGLGLYLGWLAERTGSVVPSALAHVLNNLVAFSVARWAPDVASRDLRQLGMLVVLAVAWACVARLWRQTEPEEHAAPADAVAPPGAAREPSPEELEAALAELGAQTVTRTSAKVAGGLLALQGALWLVPLGHPPPAPWVGAGLLALGLAGVFDARGALRGLVLLWAAAAAVLVFAAVVRSGGALALGLATAPWLAVLYLASNERTRPATLLATLLGAGPMLWQLASLGA